MYGLFGDPSTLFYTEVAVLPLKKSPWSKLMFLSQRSYLKVVLETTSEKSSSSHWFQFSMPPEAPVHSATQACLSRRFLFRRFTCTPPRPCARACAHAPVCAQLPARSRKKGCPGSRGDAGYCKNTASPAWKLQSYMWKLNPKLLIHLGMEILASPDLHIETYMTSFSDRLFFFYPCLLKLAK